MTSIPPGSPSSDSSSSKVPWLSSCSSSLTLSSSSSALPSSFSASSSSSSKPPSSDSDFRGLAFSTAAGTAGLLWRSLPFLLCGDFAPVSSMKRPFNTVIATTNSSWLLMLGSTKSQGSSEDMRTTAHCLSSSDNLPNADVFATSAASAALLATAALTLVVATSCLSYLPSTLRFLRMRSRRMRAFVLLPDSRSIQVVSRPSFTQDLTNLRVQPST
mmetsp:Transcript_4406/g.11757  ORF Transcript_4406/g.11757 Transcript_4406/m.11757 type:complete len:216 (-) Transcript_4406:440-1087(-)